MKYCQKWRTACNINYIKYSDRKYDPIQNMMKKVKNKMKYNSMYYNDIMKFYPVCFSKWKKAWKKSLNEDWFKRLGMAWNITQYEICFSKVNNSVKQIPIWDMI